MFDNCLDFEWDDLAKLAEKDTNLTITDFDLYYSFSFTVETEDYSLIPAAVQKLREFVDKHFLPWHRKA